jgi:hypothetical protein
MEMVGLRIVFSSHSGTEHNQWLVALVVISLTAQVCVSCLLANNHTFSAAVTC